MNTKYYDVDDIIMEEEVGFRSFVFFFFLNVLPIGMYARECHRMMFYSVANFNRINYQFIVFTIKIQNTS